LIPDRKGFEEFFESFVADAATTPRKWLMSDAPASRMGAAV
jgi:hypothetical protein